MADPETLTCDLRCQDLDFFVVLEACETGHQVDGRSSRTTVTVVDADKAGNFAWSRANNTRVKHTERQAFLVIERRAAFGVSWIRGSGIRCLMRDDRVNKG